MEKYINELRKNPAIGSIWIGFPYESDYIFLVSPHKDFIPGDPEASYIRMDANYNLTWFKYDSEIMAFISKNRGIEKYIDISKEDIARVN